MNVTMLLLGIAVGAAVGGLTVWLVSLTRVARDTFASLSAEALRQNLQSFLALAQTKLGEFQLSASSELEKRQKAVDDLGRAGLSASAVHRTARERRYLVISTA